MDTENFVLVTLGTQKFQFDRLLAEIDRLVETGEITCKIFAQTGGSDYEPKHFEHLKFLPKNEMKKMKQNADVIITHGGSGSIIEALKMKKKVIAIPRLEKYGEHVDDHQTEIVSKFADEGYIIQVREMKDLGDAIKNIEKFNPREYKGSSEELIDAIINIIESL